MLTPSSASPAPMDAPALRAAAEHIDRIIRDALDLEAAHADTLDSVAPAHAGGAANLIHYVAFRRHDIRALQEVLARHGLSSLGRAEPYVLATLRAVRRAIAALLGEPAPDGQGLGDFIAGPAEAGLHTDAALGPSPAGRRTRIMVTMPSEAADDPGLIPGLVRAGMDVMRINGAHDAPTQWLAMLGHLERAHKAGAPIERRCRVMMDLAGPKLRTGPMEPGPTVLRLRPERDRYGRATSPARAQVRAHEDNAPPGLPIVSLPRALWASASVGDRLLLRDARGSRRSLRVAEVTPERLIVEALRTTYITPGLRVALVRARDAPATAPAALVGPIAPSLGSMVLRTGDELVMTRGREPGRAARAASALGPATPARIGCTLEEVFDAAKIGDPVWLDDGKIGARVESVRESEISLRITAAPPGGARLTADKGINLPETDVDTPSLTPADLAAIGLVARHADLVGLSFVRAPADIDAALEAIRAATPAGREAPGVILKVETRRAFDDLPMLLLALMRSPVAGVMVARGDLAVEVGYERLAEVQEEILCLCEAARLPTIWATQVLERLAKKGRPTRAEVTDAAVSVRADCVMLNKGPHVDLAVAALSDILRRMSSHQRGKTPMLRALGVARQFGAGMLRP